jgi:hypothetical protein
MTSKAPSLSLNGKKLKEKINSILKDKQKTDEK